MIPLVALIPAYKPGPALIRLVEALGREHWRAIVVVDDGSGAEFPDLPEVEILHHGVNLGKGAALKTGINHVMVRYPDAPGVVTADADGQHAPEDIRRVAESLIRRPDSLFLGVRSFDGDVPWKSRAGNRLASLGVRLALGARISDTQTGLRAVPRSLFPRLLAIPANGYDFELDVITAARHSGCRIEEIPIRTIYEDANRASHFNPWRDSMRISFVLARFAAVSLATAAIDNAVFLAAYPMIGSIVRSQVLARLAAMAFQYPAARRAVFLSDEPHRITLPRFIALVAASGAASYSLIDVFAPRLGVMGAKLAAESALFLANFAISRDFVFTRRSGR